LIPRIVVGPRFLREAGTGSGCRSHADTRRVEWRKWIGPYHRLALEAGAVVALPHRDRDGATTAERVDHPAGARLQERGAAHPKAEPLLVILRSADLDRDASFSLDRDASFSTSAVGYPNPKAVSVHQV